MPLWICKTCNGNKTVYVGPDRRICPTCNGSGGIPLGAPPTNFAPTEPPSGHSRASVHLNSTASLARSHMPVEEG